MIFKNIKRIGLIVSLSILSVANIFSQNTFRVSYPSGFAFGIIGDVAESAAGNYAFAGGVLLGDFLELDNAGIPQVGKSYTDLSTLFSDVVAISTGYMVAGTGGNEMLLAELDATGSLVWGSEYSANTGTNEWAEEVIATSDGGYLLVGNVDGYDVDGGGATLPYDSSNFYIVKTNATGTVVWDKIMLPFPAFDEHNTLYDAAEVSNGYIFVGSVTEAVASDITDGFVFKTDFNGNLQWSKRFGGTGSYEGFYTISTLSNGQVLIGGDDDEDMLLMRIDINGNVTWSYSYTLADVILIDNPDPFPDITCSPTSSEIVYKVFETNDGKYACVGTIFNLGICGGADVTRIGTYLTKVEPANGGIIFSKFYESNSPLPIDFSGVIPTGMQTSDNGYLMGMLLMEQNPIGHNYHLIKVDANGEAPGSTCVIADLDFAVTTLTPTLPNVTPGEYSNTTKSTYTSINQTFNPTPYGTCCSFTDASLASPSATTICSGQSTTITASGDGTSFEVFQGATSLGNAPVTVSPTSNTTYTIESSSPLGCTSSNTVSVTINVTPTPTVTLSPATATICLGETQALVAGGATSYTWSPSTGLSATTGTNVNATPTSVGSQSYTVTGTTSGCTNTASTTITVNAPAVAVITGPATACDNELITLDASGSTGNSYSWSTGETTSSITTIAGTGITVTVGAAGCTQTDQATHPITINASPNASITGTDVCTGNSTTLTASGGASYIWIPGGTTGSTLSVSPTVMTSYDVEVTAANGCKDTAQFTVNVNGLPTVVANASDVSPCAGSQISLFGSGANSYTWDNSVIDGALFTPSAITYTVTGTDINGCENTDQITIAIDALPDVAANSNVGTTVCDGSTIILTGSSTQDPNVSYSWNLSVTDGIGFVPPGGTTTTYEVTATNTTTGCVNPIPASIDILSTAPPVAAINGTANGSVTACSNATTTLIITPAGGTYLWSTGATTQSIDVIPTSNTTYTATVTIGSCTDGTDYTVTVNTAPTGAVLGTGNNLVCTGTNDTLTASGGTTYLWNTTETTPSVVVTPTANTDYTVVVYDANNCTDTLTYSVAVNPLPTISITGTDTICSGTSTILSANGGIGYVWSTTETTQTITVSPALNTTYTVTGTDGNGCQNTDQIIVVAMAPPSAAVTGDTITCTGQAVTLTAAGGNSYVWNTGESTQIISVSPGTTTTYTVVAFVGTCTDTANYIVNVTSPPNVSIGADTAIIIGQSFTLNATGATEYSWIPPNDGIDASELNMSNPTASPEETIEYCVVGEQYGCVDTACINVEVVIDCGKIFVPNAFSPNGDNNNDCLKVYNNCLETMTLRIYARWGEVVFETTDIEACWDGTYKGQELNTATFAFVLEYSLIDGTSDVLKGNVSLIK